MTDSLDRRKCDPQIAVLAERISQLERRCDKKDTKIEAIQAFQNKALGYAMAASGVVALAVQYFSSHGG